MAMTNVAWKGWPCGVEKPIRGRIKDHTASTSGLVSAQNVMLATLQQW